MRLASNPQAARLADANRIGFQATANEYGQALGAIEAYLAALRVSIEHGERLPDVKADAAFLNFAKILVDQMLPTMRRKQAQNVAEVA